MGAIPSVAVGAPFSVLRDGYRIHVALAGEPKWTIDPALFGASAKASLEHSISEVRISLRNARFPGTAIAADFDCRLASVREAWLLDMKFISGIEVKAELLPWLMGKSAATGQWETQVLRPCEGFEVRFSEAPTAEFRPDWSVHLSGAARARVRGLRPALPTSQCALILNHPERISGNPGVGHRTSFLIRRRGASWPVALSRESERGWSLDHRSSDELFDELRVETTQNTNTVVRTALLLQDPDNAAPVRLFTGGALLSDSGEPYHLALNNPRLAFTLDEEGPSRALMADLGTERTWAHSPDASYLLTSAEEGGGFELHEGPTASGTPELRAGLCAICLPSEAACVSLTLGKPRPIPFTWADLAAPFEQLAAWLHLLPSQHGSKLVIDLERGDFLSIERPYDLLSLQFKFHNMRLITGIFPRIVHGKGEGLGSVSVIFPPQHAAEEAFYHADDPDPLGHQGLKNLGVPIGNVELTDYLGALPANPAPALVALKKLYDPEASVTPPDTDKLQPGIKFSGETNLAFQFPHKHYEIPCNLDSLLDWSHWQPIVVPVAQSTITFDTMQPSPIRAPLEFETSIELPYRLALSPSDLGRWTHAIKPVESKSNVIELWHTRLGVKPSKKDAAVKESPNTVDETNNKDRTARAVWSLDFMPVSPLSCTAGPDLFPAHYSPQDPITDANPFRMALDIRDRCELVHLTSNYNITQQAGFCYPNPILPGKPLLVPTPVQVNRMMLTALGGYLEAFGQWNPCKVDGTHQLTVELWKQITTLGRDHYVKVLYKGYLAPFGLRASLVKVTQRYFELSSDKNWVAILHQHMYIVVKNERKQFPILGQPYAGRAFPFSYVEPITLRTPFLNDPASQKFPRDPGISQQQSLFWPMVPDPHGSKNPSLFGFRLRFTDVTGAHTAESTMPLLFVASDVAQGDGGTQAIPSSGNPNFTSQDAVHFYNRGSIPPAPSTKDPYLAAGFVGTKLSFAASATPGDTDFETDTLSWSAAPVSTSVTVTVTGPAGTPYGATNPNAYVTLTSAATGHSVVQTLSALGPYTLTVDSGSIIASVTTPMPNLTPPYLIVTSGALPVAGSVSYTLDFTLSDATHFASLPTLVKAGTNPAISPTDLYRHDLPYFYPAVDYALITSTSIKRITGSSDATKFNFFPTYLAVGFNPSSNLGEVFFQKHPDDTLALQFGGGNGNVDKAGGLASPDALIVGFSRKGGPVGGKTSSVNGNAQRNAGANSPVASNTVISSVSTFSSGKFDAADFFGGLLSAKLLGAVNLSDIIAPISSGLSNLAQAPQMIEKALYSAETYSAAAASAIADFQKVPYNPLAAPLAGQAQAVADAGTALTTALTEGDSVAAAVAEAQLLARIAEYTAAVQGALQNPLSLIEDAIISALAPAVSSAIAAATTAAQAQISALIQTLSTQLDTTIQNVLLALEPLGMALAQTTLDAITAADQTAKNLAQPIQNAISILAPDLNQAYQLYQQIPALSKAFSDLGSSVSAALSNPSRLPQVLVAANTVLTELQPIYQSTGFLGVVVSQSSVGAKLLAVRDQLRAFWNLADYTTDLDAFHDDCLQLASYCAQSVAQPILQSLGQLESAVQKATLYRTRVANSPPQTIHPVPQPLSDVDKFRELQLLQQMQGQILSALAALQVIAQTAPVSGAPNIIQQAAKNIDGAAAGLAAGLTVVSQLWNAASATYGIEIQLKALITDMYATKPLAASSQDLYNQILALRAQIVANPADVSLQLLLYNLSVDYQRPLATGLAYLAYVENGADKAIATYLPRILGAIETLANALQTALCALSGAWTVLRGTIQGLQGPLQVKLGPIIDSLFGSDLAAIDKAFAALCTAGATTPSEYLRNGRNLIAAFSALEQDVRSKITSLPAIETALLQAVQQEIDTLLATLLADIPIPTSINLSYTWHPEIQSCPPVFLLNPGADFSVKASAEADLSASLTLTAAADISASLTNFSIALIGDEPFITLVITSLTFTSHNSSKPDVRLSLNTVVFGASMKFVQDLADLLDPTDGPFIELAPDSIRAGFRFAIESMTLGAFNLMQLAIEVAVALPFDGTPVRCEMGLSDQQQPFLLSCGIYGGGGFLQLQLGLDGVQLLQGAFEFGVCADINIGPLTGSGFCVAGIYFRVTADSSEVCGFVHAHGHMDIFGIVTLDVDLYVAVCYDSSGSVEGIATFSVSVSIGFFSESFSMQAQYAFAGSGTSQSVQGPAAQPAVHSHVQIAAPKPEKVVPIEAYRSAKNAAAAKSKPLPRPAHSTIEPGKWQQMNHLVDETIWKDYYDAFTTA